MNLLLVLIFISGYVIIAAESGVKINKAATALVTGIICWIIYAFSLGDEVQISGQLAVHLSEISGILFFLLGAMTIVELIDSHEGFNLISTRITQTKKSILIWIISFITFFLSAVLDNLTTTIVMISLVQKLTDDENDRLLFAGMIVIAANAGGAWSPIGDVTTTMLWIGGQITSWNIISKLFLPSLVCLVIPLLILSRQLKGRIKPIPVKENTSTGKISRRHQSIVFVAGLTVLILVPVFKTVTHLPPFMGMLFGLGILWILTEIIHGRKKPEDKRDLSVASALRNIDAPSILFFLGILLAISALQSAGILSALSTWTSAKISNLNILVPLIGIFSSVVDNVPLVAAAQGMYDLSIYPTDHYFWEFIAFCTGTGGSILIIGSAAGVVAMGMEKITFSWYLRKISWLAFAGYISGALMYILQHQVISSLH